MIQSKWVLFSLASQLLLFISCTSNEKKPSRPAPETNTIEILKRAIPKYPDSLMLVHNLIEAYRNEGFYDSAIALTESAIEKDSGNAYLWNIKGTLYFENGDTMKAIESLMNAIEIYPLPEYLIALGTVFAEIKNPEALEIADELLKYNRKKSGDDAFFIKGLYYNYINQPKTAITYLDSSLKLDFTFMYAYREKAIALFELKKYPDAIRVLKRAVTLQNNYEEGYYWMGKTYEMMNQKKEAIQSYKNALLYDKDYVEARKALNRLLETTPL